MGPRSSYSKEELELIRKRGARTDLTLKISQNKLIGKIPQISFSETNSNAYDNKAYNDPYCTHNSVLIKCLFLKVPIEKIKVLMNLQRDDLLPPKTEPYDNFIKLTTYGPHGPCGSKGSIGGCYDPTILDQHINSEFYLGLASTLHSDEAIQYFIEYFKPHLVNIFTHLLVNYNEMYILRLCKHIEIDDWFLHYYLLKHKDANISLKVVNALITDKSLKYSLPKNTCYSDIYPKNNDYLSTTNELYLKAWQKLFIMGINKEK